MNYLFDLTGKTAIVTGGGRGIGLMIARGLHQAGAEVHLVSRKIEACQAAADSLGDGAVAWGADLSNEAACIAFAHDFLNQVPKLDILVNNAGAAWGAPLAEFDTAAWDKILNVNLKSPFFLIREFVESLSAAGSAEDPSRIINIGSIDGLRVPLLETYSYTSSKAALHNLTQVLAVRLGPKNITVNAIAPGAFETKMMAGVLEETGDEFANANPLGRNGIPDDIAGLTIALAAKSGSYINGAVIPLDGGLTLVSPR